MATPPHWIDGFSKLDKDGKRRWVAEAYGSDPGELIARWRGFDHADAATQERLDSFAENTVANFPLPLGVAPNVLVDGELYAVPMAVEESSVVAAASAAAKYWARRGGFRTELLGDERVGQLYLRWGGRGGAEAIRARLPALERELRAASAALTANMERRGGGVRGLELVDYPELAGTYELRGRFGTCDSMGANFVNSVLEAWGQALPSAFAKAGLTADNGEADATTPRRLMAILSNYTPESRVRAEVRCAVDELGPGTRGFSAAELADRFHAAVELAWASPYRATTHNKGIYNGVDAVVIATGNDFRAVEACGHAYAARDGQYRSLSRCSLDGGEFRFWLELPLALGTVGGLTRAHPLADAALDLLGRPGAGQLMRIVAATGLAQNFAAVRSLVTTGIQAGHMRMHLQNILTQLDCDGDTRRAATAHFAERAVSFAGVRAWVEERGV